MCLIIESIADYHVAEKPMTVYKILRKDDDKYKTPFQGIVCEIGTSIRARRKFDNIDIDTDDIGRDHEVNGEGVHAYKSLFAARHSDLPYSYTFANKYFYITEWEIPKGAKYWEGIENSCLEIAATEMKFIDIIEQCKPQEDYLLRPFFGCTAIDNTIDKIATHYITDEGEVAPIKKGQQVDVWHLAWVIDDLKEVVPKTISYDGKDYKFFIEPPKGTSLISCWITVGYHCDKHLKGPRPLLCSFTSAVLDYGFIYGRILEELIERGYFNPEDLKGKVKFKIV